MSTIQRSVTLNSIEPAPLSMRAPASMETWLDIQFYDQRGQVTTTDLAAQLHLTSRTRDLTTVYPMPATDMVNGKARAVIPAGDLNDMNGYRLRLFGTWKQQPWLLAMGSFNILPAAGVSATPDDVIDQIALSFVRNVDDYVDVKLWHDASKANPFDVSTVTVTAPYTPVTGGVSGAFTVSQIDINEVRLSLSAAQTNAMAPDNNWRLIVSSGAGQQTMAQGPLTITG